MGKIIVLMLALVAASVQASDPTVSTDTGRSKTSEKSQQISREKAIDLENSSSDRTAKAVENLKSRTFNTEFLNQYTSRSDTQAAILFEPLVSAIERGEVNMGTNKVADLFRRCGLYSYPHPVASSLFIRPMSGVKLRIGSMETNVGVNPAKNYGVAHTSLETPAGAPLHVAISDQSLYRYSQEMENKPQRFAPPSEAMRCYMGYSYVLSETIKEIANQAIGRKKPNAKKGEKSQTFFLIESLEAMAAKALVAVISDPTTLDQVDNKTKQIVDGGCVLPTLAALNSGNFVWSCGGVDIDPSKGIAKRSGTPYFGENTFMGVSALFAQVDAVAMSSGLSQSDVERNSKVKELAKAKSTRLSKRKGQSSGISTGDTMGSGSGVSQ